MKAEENGTLSLKCWKNTIVIQELLWQQNNCPIEVFLREKFIDLKVSVIKKYKINHFSFHLRTLVSKEHIKPSYIEEMSEWK